MWLVDGRLKRSTSRYPTRNGDYRPVCPKRKEDIADM